MPIVPFVGRGNQTVEMSDHFAAGEAAAGRFDGLEADLAAVAGLRSEPVQEVFVVGEVVGQGSDYAVAFG
jgi:hypothetical protein